MSELAPNPTPEQALRQELERPEVFEGEDRLDALKGAVDRFFSS